MTAAWVVLAGLVVGLGGQRAVGKLGGRVSLADRLGNGVTAELLASDLLKWVGLLPTVVWVVGVERAGFASVTGTRLPPLTLVGVVCGGVVVTFVASAAIQRATSALGFGGVAEGETLERVSDRSTAAILTTGVTAGVTEELVFRGFLIERLVRLTGSPAVAGVASLVAFGAVHYGYWDLEETVEITAQGAVLVGIYLLVPSVIALAAIHAIHDVLGMVLARRAVGDAADAPDVTEA